MGKNCGFFNKSIFLAQSGFSVECLYCSCGRPDKKIMIVRPSEIDLQIHYHNLAYGTYQLIDSWWGHLLFSRERVDVLYFFIILYYFVQSNIVSNQQIECMSKSFLEFWVKFEFSQITGSPLQTLQSQKLTFSSSK